MAIVTQHNPAESRYTIEVDGQVAGFADYVESGTVRDFNHTVVFDEFQGQGLSKPLIKEALMIPCAAASALSPPVPQWPTSWPKTQAIWSSQPPRKRPGPPV